MWLKCILCLFVTGVVFTSFIAKNLSGGLKVLHSAVLRLSFNLAFQIYMKCAVFIFCICTVCLLFLASISEVVIIIQCQMVSVSIYFGLFYRALMMCWFCQEVCQEPRIWQR